jgi:hypothetical protein
MHPFNDAVSFEYNQVLGVSHLNNCAIVACASEDFPVIRTRKITRDLVE